MGQSRTSHVLWRHASAYLSAFFALVCVLVGTLVAPATARAGSDSRIGLLIFPDYFCVTKVGGGGVTKPLSMKLDTSAFWTVPSSRF